MENLPCDALITYQAPTVLPRPGGAMLRIGEGVDWCAAAAPWLTQTIRYSQQSLGLAVGGPETPREHELAALIADHYHRAEVHSATITQFSERWGLNFCRTLLREPRWATSLGDPWKGRPAFIVSAGPSLDRNGALLAEAQKRGPVIALNSSVSACMQYGVVPDLVMCSEAVDVSAKLHAIAGMGIQVAIDAVANPLNWDAAPDAWAYAWAEPSLVPHVLQLGALPLVYTGSVACGAVALALLWGADPVVLIGQDCAYTDGRMYASGTPYADIRCEALDGILRFTGKSKQCDPILAVNRVAWGGEGQVTTSHDLEVFVDWFELAAKDHTIVNATEGGARIQYTYEQPLARVLEAMPEQPRVQLPEPERPDYAAVREEIRQRARDLLAGDDVAPPYAFKLINMWAVGATFRMHGMQPLERHKCMREAMERGAREILEVLG